MSGGGVRVSLSAIEGTAAGRSTHHMDTRACADPVSTFSCGLYLVESKEGFLLVPQLP